jgi:putative oxidoreductase
MTPILDAYDRLAAAAAAAAPALLPLLARLVFAGVLLFYFWGSAATKLGDGAFGILFPSDGAYVQVFPRAMEAAGYDVSQLGLWHWAVVTAGLWAEFILPLLLVLGLFGRLAALGLIGFVIVQSMTDIYGHGVAGADLGAWFDAASDSLIVDQRSLWIFLLGVPVLLGSGALSLDRALVRLRGLGHPVAAKP